MKSSTILANILLWWCDLIVVEDGKMWRRNGAAETETMRAGVTYAFGKGEWGGRRWARTESAAVGNGGGRRWRRQRTRPTSCSRSWAASAAHKAAWWLRVEWAAVAPWRTSASVGGTRADTARCTAALYVGAETTEAPTLAASNVCYSSGSYSPDSSQLFSHSGNALVLYSDEPHSKSTTCSHPFAVESLLFGSDPNLSNK